MLPSIPRDSDLEKVKEDPVGLADTLWLENLEIMNYRCFKETSWVARWRNG